MSTTPSIPAHKITSKWYIVDAANQKLGRLASMVAFRLRGKHTPLFTPHVNCGDHVIVINASKVVISGNKAKDKVYYHHSGYPGGLKTTSFTNMMGKHPERVIEKAVWGMLPKGPLGRAIFKKLKVYRGNFHPHASQQPITLDINNDGK